MTFCIMGTKKFYYEGGLKNEEKANINFVSAVHGAGNTTGDGGSYRTNRYMGWSVS